LRLRLFSFGGYGLALAALALVVFGAYDSYPATSNLTRKVKYSDMREVLIDTVYSVKRHSNLYFRELEIA